jgi:hypothetical protein
MTKHSIQYNPSKDNPKYILTKIFLGYLSANIHTTYPLEVHFSRLQVMDVAQIFEGHGRLPLSYILRSSVPCPLMSF